MTNDDKLNLALSTVNMLLNLQLGETVRGQEYKGIRPDDEQGGLCKLYLDSYDCRQLAQAFQKLSEALAEEKG